jgi:putative endonuclease
MFYVYLITSQAKADERYIGSTDDLRKRLAEHNAGKSIHTNKFKPWKLVTYLAFETRIKAEAFEKYLKHGSGYAFAKRHLW